MEIRYAQEIVKRIEKLGMNIARLDIREENVPDDPFRRTMDNGILPGLFYTEGGYSREGVVIITGIDAVEVARTAVKIASADG